MTVFDDIAALPPERRERMEAALSDMERDAFVRGYLFAQIWLAVWQWQYGKSP